MFDHVKFGVSDYAASKAFFLKALEPLGVAVVSEGPPAYGVELSPKGKASLCLYQTDEKPAHLHLAFTAETRQQVEAFYRAALEAGAKTMVRLVCARTTTRTTMQHSSLVRTGTTSKWFATKRSVPSTFRQITCASATDRRKRQACLFPRAVPFVLTPGGLVGRARTWRQRVRLPARCFARPWFPPSGVPLPAAQQRVPHAQHLARPT